MPRALAVLSLLCALGCSASAPPAEIRATVAEVFSYRTLGGDIRHRVTLEYRDAAGVLNRQQVEVEMREWLRFGREGAEVCLHRWGGGWRMDECR